MAFLDRIRACNTHDMQAFIPFRVEGLILGWVRRDVAKGLTDFASVFQVSQQAVDLQPHFDTPAKRTQALADIAPQLVERWQLGALRHEDYPVVRRWGDEPALLMDRALVLLFGVPSHGVHVNGFVRRPDGLYLWIGTRSATKAVAPGKLDNMIAGGQPHNLTLMENLAKEAAEEADIPAPLAETARPVGLISYVAQESKGLRPDVMFCFDLDVPEDFVPRNTDGEIDHFALIKAEEVAAIVRDTDQFKPNVNLVIIDFLIRHGILTPDSEPDYISLVRGLRQEIITVSP